MLPCELNENNLLGIFCRRLQSRPQLVFHPVDLANMLPSSSSAAIAS
jgi:hypothetical protein